MMSIRPARVQIVTDQSVILSAVSRAYRNKPVDIVTAPNTSLAQEQQDVIGFDLFLLDLDMTESCSFKLLAVMTERFPQVPIILMTTGDAQSKEMIAKIEAIRSASTWSLLEKPFKYKKLVDYIASALLK